MQIAEVQLATMHLAAQKAFYRDVLELPLVAETLTAFTVQAGASALTFVETAAPLPSIYHVAFNIPENQLAAAKVWLTQRVPLLQNGDSDEWVFPDWNAHTVYYLDADGNILEAIARHNLPTASTQPFTAQSFLSISEIGLATLDVRAFCQQLHTDLGVERWRGNETNFAAVGDEEGLFIVAVNGRPWNGNEAPAHPLPTTVVLQGEESKVFVFDGLPYQILVQSPNVGS